MEYTESDACVVHSSTGRRMHQSHLPVPTAVSATDMNMVIWSLMALLEQAGITPATFDPDDEDSYTRFKAALNGLFTKIEDLATGAPGKGAALVKMRQALTDAIERLLSDKLRESVCVTDWGAVADGTTDAWTAYTKARAASVVAGKYCVRFPFVVGAANVYRFASLDTNYFANTHLVVDDGVTLSWPDGSWIGVETITWARPAKNVFRDWGNFEWLSGKRQLNDTPTSKSLWVDAAAFNRAKFAPINGAALSLLKTDWAAGAGTDVFTADASSTPTASGVTFAPTNDGAFHLALQRVEAGDQLQSVFVNATAANVLIAAMVRTESGYCMVHAPTADLQAATFVQKPIGGAITTTPFTWLSYDTHASYSPGRSVWAIEIQSSDTWALKFNGYEVMRGRSAGDKIIQAGFGIYPLASGQSVTSDYWVRSTDRQPGGKPFTRVALFGDSKTTFRQDNWRLAFTDAMEATAGLQVQVVGNYATGGHTSAQQLAVMMAADLTGVDEVLIDVGTNDVQTGVSVATYLSNVAAMVARAATFGARCHFAVPYLFYGTAQSGAGIATANYASGAPHRAALVRYCAENNIGCLDQTEFSGMVSYAFRGALAAAKIDARVLDNIHGTPFLARLQGREWAKYLAGKLCPDSTLAITRTLIAGSYAATGYSFTSNQPLYSRDEGGMVWICGTVDRGAGSLADGTTICTVPQIIRPVDTIRGMLMTDTGVAGFVLDQTGALKIYRATAAATQVYLNVSYSNRLSY